MTDKDKKIIRDLVVKAKGYYDGIDERLTDALKAILRRLDKPDHIPGVRKKVEIDVVKIRALIDEIAHSPCLAYDGCDDKKCVCPRGIAQKALTLLPEPCPTCGGSGKLHCKSVTPGTINCPDCQSQEPAETSEFVKECRKLINSQKILGVFGELLENKLEKACKHLEAAKKYTQIEIDDLVFDIEEIICEHVSEPAGHGCGYGISAEGEVEITNLIKEFLGRTGKHYPGP